MGAPAISVNGQRTAAALAVMLVCAAVTLPVRGETLREVLLRHNVAPTPDGPGGLERPVTSYAVENGEDLFAIAFFWLPDGSMHLPDPPSCEFPL